MKKNTLKSFEPQTRSLFRFKNSDTKNKFANGQNVRFFGDGTDNTDPTATTTTIISI